MQNVVTSSTVIFVFIYLIGLTIRAFDLLKMTNKRTIRILVNRVSVNKLPLKEANSKKRSTIIDSTSDDTQNRPNKLPKLLTTSSIANSVIITDSMEVSSQSQMCQNYELIDLCSSGSDTSSISGSVEPFDNDYGENMPTTSSVQLTQEFVSTPNLIF